jgi:hypothetical protein
MFRLFSHQNQFVPQVLTLNTLCDDPRIKAAMQKENITEENLAASNVNLELLHHFASHPDIDYWYALGAFTFSEYVFTAGLAESAYQMLFSSTGMYALHSKYISIPQFLLLSKYAQEGLCIFKTCDNDHGEYSRCIKQIDRIFSTGFDFEKYNGLASSSEYSKFWDEMLTELGYTTSLSMSSNG